MSPSLLHLRVLRSPAVTLSLYRRAAAAQTPHHYQLLAPRLSLSSGQLFLTVGVRLVLELVVLAPRDLNPRPVLVFHIFTEVLGAVHHLAQTVHRGDLQVLQALHTRHNIIITTKSR